MSAVIWINGAFGAGKSTLAEELRRRLPDTIPFDPEYVGYILRGWVPAAPSGDFQDIPLWRRMVAQFAIGLADDYRRPLIVPMTLVNPTYRAEIFGPIRAAGHDLVHAFLDVPAEELHRRIDAQETGPGGEIFNDESRVFRHGNVDRCVAAAAELPPDTLVLPADKMSPAGLAEAILAAIPPTDTGA